MRRNNTENAWSSDYYQDFFPIFRQFSHVNCAHIAANFQSNIRPSVCVFTCIRTRAIWVDFCTATKSHAYAFFALSLIFATDVNILAPIMECFIYSSCRRGKTTRISCFALRRLQIIYYSTALARREKMNEWMQKNNKQIWLAEVITIKCAQRTHFFHGLQAQWKKTMFERNRWAILYIETHCKKTVQSTWKQYGKAISYYYSIVYVQSCIWELNVP